MNTPRRRSGPVFIGFGVLAAALLFELYFVAFAAPATRGRIAREAALVADFGLTDPALFTEARYTRHPSLADLNTPFQDHPMSFDHFPSGSIMPVPKLPGEGWLIFQPQGPKP
ncbi:hypothetical protein [Thioclava sp.]|uniref:hypothetical protein n=1 Tax=Thioclava sp. TaxID=1933450 RepID=UPI003AA9678A